MEINLIWILLALNTIWLLGITFFIYQNILKDYSLIKNLFVKDGVDYKERLTGILQEAKNWQSVEKSCLECLQKVALKRYNPYQDTGGDQSFSLSLLDGKGNGVVVTSLHSRAGTRVFAKPVKEGKEEKFQFSDEESQVVAMALRTL